MYYFFTPAECNIEIAKLLHPCSQSECRYFYMVAISMFISFSVMVAPPDMVKTITEEEHDKIKGSKKGSVSSQSSLSKRFLNADTMSLVRLNFASRKLFPFSPLLPSKNKGTASVGSDVSFRTRRFFEFPDECSDKYWEPETVLWLATHGCSFRNQTICEKTWLKKKKNGRKFSLFSLWDQDSGFKL